MLKKFANTQIIERITDPNVIPKINHFKNFHKRVAVIDPIKLHPEKFLYLRNRSISALETHGANQNGDGFPRNELVNRHATFIGDPITVDHTEDRVIGMVLDSAWVPKQIVKKSSGIYVPFTKLSDVEEGDQIIGDWVENILAIDKAKANAEHAKLDQQILDGEITDTSMGCLVEYSICSVPGCRTKASMPEEYCQHIAHYKGTVYCGADTNNEKHAVYEENYGLTFFEDSVIIPDNLGGTAGGEGADPGAKVLEQVAGKKDSFDLTPYIKKVAYEDTLEVGEKPESVEVGEEKHKEKQIKQLEDGKIEQLKGKIDTLVNEIEEKTDALKGLVTPEEPSSTEVDMTQGAHKISRKSKSVKKSAIIEIRSDNDNDLQWLNDQFKKENIEILNKKNKNLATVVEIFSANTYKIGELNKLAEKENKNVVLHVIESTRSKQMLNKNMPVKFKASVEKFEDGVVTIPLNMAEIEVNSKLSNKLKSKISAEKLIDLNSKKKVAISKLFIKAAEDDGEFKEGEEAEVPAVVAEEPDESGNVVLTLDVDAQTEIEDETVPIEEIIVPEDQVESEEDEEKEEGGLGELIEGSKVKIKAKAGKIKDKVLTVKISAKSGKKEISELRISAEDEEIKEGDDVTIPATVSTNPEGSDVEVKLDTNAETTIDEKDVKVTEITVPEKDVEVVSSKTKGQTGPGDPNPKSKVPDAGAGNGANSFPEKEFDGLQKAHEPNPKDKVPSAGGNAPKKLSRKSKASEDTNTDKIVELNEDTIQAAINKAKKKKADIPDMSIKEAPGEIPKDKSSVPEQASEEDVLGGEHDKSKEPENNVTQLSALVKKLRKSNLDLRKENIKLANDLKKANDELGEQVKTVENLQSELKPLEIDKVVTDMVRSKQLDPGAAIAQKKDLSYIYDNDKIEFAVIKRTAAMGLEKQIRSSKRKILEASKNLKAKNNDLETIDNLDNDPNNQNQIDTPSLEAGNLFED